MRSRGANRMRTGHAGQLEPGDGGRVTLNFKNAGKDLTNVDAVDLVTFREDELYG